MKSKTGDTEFVHSKKRFYSFSRRGISGIRNMNLDMWMKAVYLTIFDEGMSEIHKNDGKIEITINTIMR